MKVIKLGGSLMTDPCALRRCLRTIDLQSDEKTVIVPGGGLFADQVRALQQQWKFDDEAAHEMAVLAMCQMALICKSLSPSFIIAKNIPTIKNVLRICSRSSRATVNCGRTEHRNRSLHRVNEDFEHRPTASGSGVVDLEQILVHSVVIWSPDIEELNSFGIKASWEVTSDSLAAWLANQLTADELILVKSAEIPVKNDIHKMQKLGVLDLAFSEFSKNSNYKITLINKRHFNEYSSI